MSLIVFVFSLEEGNFFVGVFGFVFIHFSFIEVEVFGAYRGPKHLNT